MIILRKISSPQQLSECIGLGEDLLGTVDGNNQVFNTQSEYVSGTVVVFYNGQALYAGHDFEETGATEITFTYIKPGSTGFDDVLKVAYKYADCSGTASITDKGKESIDSGVDFQVIPLNVSFPNTNYVLTTDLTNTVDATPSVFPYIIGAKTTTTFTVFFQGNIDSGNYVLEWIAMAL